jgi:hypothetical protein
MTKDLHESCVRVAGCALRVGCEPWPFAGQRSADIATYWHRTSAERPKLFDGTVYMLQDETLKEDHFRGTYSCTDFKSFLYWRDSGYPDRSVRDCFGSAVVRSAEGHVLLGRQTSGNVNAGLAYPPGGFIDKRDVGVDGVIDIDASIARELAEETGLDPLKLRREPGYLLTHSGMLVSIGIEWRSALPAAALRDRVVSHVRGQAVPELADIVIVRSASEIDETTTPRYAQVLLRALLTA